MFDVSSFLVFALVFAVALVVAAFAAFMARRGGAATFAAFMARLRGGAATFAAFVALFGGAAAFAPFMTFIAIAIALQVTGVSARRERYTQLFGAGDQPTQFKFLEAPLDRKDGRAPA